MRNLVPENLKRKFRILRSQYGAFKYGNPAKKLVLIGVTGTSENQPLLIVFIIF